MGCCCSSRRADVHRAPVYYYYPRTSEECEPLPFTHGTSSVVSPVLVLNSSDPVADGAPPVIMSYGIDLLHTLPLNLRKCGMKYGQVQPTDTPLVKGSDCSECEGKLAGEQDSLDEAEDEPLKSSKPDASLSDEEDVCPTCLEEYDLENPRIITKCEHHFHLSCILEWKERSDTCPICDKIMMFDME